VVPLTSLLVFLQSFCFPGPNSINLTKLIFCRTKANWPSIHYGGWFDIFQFSAIEAFEGYNLKGGPLGRGLGYLFIDPLGHCAKDQNNYPNALEYFVLSQEFALELFKTISRDLQVFEARGGELTTEEKRAVFEGAIEAAHRNTEKKFQTNFEKLNLYLMGPSDAGARGNAWVSFPAWPTVTPMVGYFGTNGSISWSAPPSTPESASFLYDPAHPVPTLGGNNLVLPTCGSYDQREVENGRTDVLSFTSPPSPSDYTFIGRVSATLYVSSNATDTDFTVKWLDVYPDGRRMLLQDGIVRMRWRKMPDAPSQPSCIVPGTIYEISVDLQYIAFVLNKGHSIGVSVSSSNHPRFSANPNTCQPLTSNKPPVVAHNSLYMSATSPSSITLPLVSE
jgi:predicted acyl esterase